MKINSKNILYVISSIAIFLVTSTWLYIIKEERIGVYVGVLSISVLSSDFIFDPKGKWRLIIDFVAVAGILFFIGLEILNFFLNIEPL
jgi:hypothetical protein